MADIVNLGRARKAKARTAAQARAAANRAAFGRTKAQKAADVAAAATLDRTLDGARRGDAER